MVAQLILTRFFCALVRAAGFEARRVLLNTRMGPRFTGTVASSSFMMPNRCISVRLGDEWRFFDPADKYLPIGQLSWEEQGVAAMITNRNGFERTSVKVSSSEASKTLRKGRFTLSNKGILSGSVSLEYTGHFGVDLKWILDDESVSGQHRYVEEMIANFWPNAEISSIVVSNVTHPFMPLKISFVLESLSIGQVVGGDLTIPVNPFELLATSELPETKRHSDLFFKFAKTEVDDIEITLPKDFELGKAHAPRSFEMDGIFEYKPRLGIKRRSSTLVYSRSYSLKVVDFPSRHYETIRQLFQNKTLEDRHKVSLKRKSSE